MHPSHLDFIGSMEKPEVEVNCFSLNAITEALGVSYVDYLWLDVEGPEVEILLTVDWIRLHIEIITVEYYVHGKHMIDARATLKKLAGLRQFFSDTGIYQEVGVLPPGKDVDGLDVVFSRI